MKAVPLHAFMPYGAPDLIAARPRHLARALMLASALPILAMAVGMLTLRLIGVAEPIVVPEILIDPKDLMHEPLIRRPPPDVPRHPSAPKTNDAVPLPVRDEPLPPPEPSNGTDTGADAGIANAGDGAAGPGYAIDVAAATDELPRVDQIIYVEQLPTVVRKVEAVYPDLAREARVEGRVLLHVMIGKDGRVLDARVEPQYSIPLLDEAALQAARQWRFTPGMTNGHPVVCWVAIPFVFRLR